MNSKFKLTISLVNNTTQLNVSYKEVNMQK